MGNQFTNLLFDVRNDKLYICGWALREVILKEARLIVIFDKLYQLIGAYELRQVYFLVFNKLMRTVGISHTERIFFRTRLWCLDGRKRVILLIEQLLNYGWTASNDVLFIRLFLKLLRKADFEAKDAQQGQGFINRVLEFIVHGFRKFDFFLMILDDLYLKHSLFTFYHHPLLALHILQF